MDAIPAVLTSSSGQVFRVARKYADDASAQDALTRWRTAASECDGLTVEDEADRADDRQTLAMLAKGMCRFTTEGCS